MTEVETWWEPIFKGALTLGLNKDRMNELEEESFLYFEEEKKVMESTNWIAILPKISLSFLSTRTSWFFQSKISLVQCLYLNHDSSTVNFVIKGNINRKGNKIYHIPGNKDYDLTKREIWFCSEQEAKDEGFKKAG